jgi:predicted ATPase
MLTRLRFKNWRSLRDVEIDELTPLTVLIGANASGKTNILDALRFLRDMTNADSLSWLSYYLEREKARTLGASSDDPIELELSFQLPTDESRHLTYTLDLNPAGQDVDFAERLIDPATSMLLEAKNGSGSIKRNGIKILPYRQVKQEPGLILRSLGQLFSADAFQTDPELHLDSLFAFIAYRWQLLDENFMPPLRFPNSQATNSFYLVERCADNVVEMLDFMQRKHPEVYAEFQSDFVWLLEHAETIQTERSEFETRVQIQENGRLAPTISAGTARIAAILTAVFALDMRYAEMPGLIAIEEPDTALNPGLLRNFVEQLRNYASGDHPRQFILTTHNPSFLNYFEPEEVRVVERDKQGYTTVKKIPDHIRDIWLDEYRLGEVWFTHSFGGLPK